MKNRQVYLKFPFISICLAACVFAAIFQAYAQENITEKSWKKYFDGRTDDGTIVIYDMKKDQYLVYNKARAEKRFSPASTFKIPNSLIALETRAIKDTDTDIIKWDEKTREFEDWNKDQTLRSAFEVSAVWAYQELARRVGDIQMNHYVKKIDYGNNDTSGGVDQFWLESSLEINAFEQVKFLKELYDEELSFSRENQEKVKDIMLNESSDNYKLRAKTGWARDKLQMGWFVGWLETGGDVYFFAMNMNIKSTSQIGYRKEIAKEILSEVSGTMFKESN